MPNIISSGLMDIIVLLGRRGTQMKREAPEKISTGRFTGVQSGYKEFNPENKLKEHTQCFCKTSLF